MIIQCEKCKTRFKLDDSRITDSGIRVRCSRCSHTFVVQREAPDEDSDFESILQGLGGNEPSGQDEVEVSPGIGFSSDKTLAGSGFSSDSLSCDEEDQEPDSSPVNSQTDIEEEEAEPEQAEIHRQSFSDLLRKGVGLPQFQMPSACDASEKTPDLKANGRGSALSSLFDNPPVQNDPPLDQEPDSPALCPVTEEPLESGASKDPEQSLSIRESIWPVADSKDEEEVDDNLSPLSITSRRKGSPFLPILMGVLLVLVLGGAGFYLVSVHSGGWADSLPESVKASLGLGKKAGGLVEIRSLEGAFLSNRDAGEIFVMKGDAFNISSKPLTTIQVKGKVYGINGEVLAQQTVFCGNVFSGEQLAVQPYSSMAKVMGRQFGETLANFQVQPGKGVPFVIVFKDVPRGAKDFGAEVMSPSGSNAR
ncbi:MAG: DUF3426 domain-containing protein [Geobacteraceae bacterium]|nr:DUF3426 domain-containing protein [Geobacteraceae bacterium]